ncbi:MAG: transporter [Candidatus Saccharibacteria bacterium]|nr:transporter [Candidatus Saccharibacteria bacterium]
MKLRRLTAAFNATVLGASSILAMGLTGVAHAAGNTCTWTGATNNNFSTATNWSNCASGAPTNGDNLVFDATALTASQTLNNNITGLTTGTILFSGANTNFYSYTITGNSITIGGNVTVSTTTYVTINTDIALASDVVITQAANSAGVTYGDGQGTNDRVFDTQGHHLTLTGPGANCNTNFFSKLSGSGAVTASFSDGGVSFIKPTTSYTGAVNVTSGRLGATKNSLGSTSGITVAGGSLIIGLAANDSIGYPLSLSGPGSTTAATLSVTNGLGACSGGAPSEMLTATFTGPVTLITDILYGGVYNAVVTGTYTANGNYVTNKEGAAGTFTANGSSTATSYTKRTIVESDSQPTQSEYVYSGQEVTLDGSRKDVEVFAGGRLQGTGTVALLQVDANAIVAPGHSPGCMTVTGGLKEYGTYEAEIGGTTACSEYDQLKVTGTVDLGDGSTNPQGKLVVSLYNGFKPAAGQSYTLIDNDGSDAVTGTFNGMEEGSTFTIDGYVFTITYKGGDGNDVVVSIKNVPSTPDTGFALITANPLMTLVVATAAAGAIAVVARKTRTAPATVRRRK